MKKGRRERVGKGSGLFYIPLLTGINVCFPLKLLAITNFIPCCGSRIRNIVLPALYIFQLQYVYGRYLYHKGLFLVPERVLDKFLDFRSTAQLAKGEKEGELKREVLLLKSEYIVRKLLSL